MKCDRWSLRASHDAHLLHTPNNFGIRDSPIAAYRRRDYKSASIFRTNFGHSNIALCRGETSLAKRIRNWGAQMAITFLDLIAVLLWPFVFSAAVWVIAVKALAETDEISKVVEALTRPNDVEQNAKRRAVFLRDRSLGAISNRRAKG